MATEKPCKNTLHFGFSCSYLKNELGDPIFLLYKSNQQAKMKVYAKFKKILWSRFSATLKLFSCEGGYESAPQIFFKLCSKFHSGLLIYISEIKKWGSPSSILRYRQQKPKYGVFMQGFPVAMVTLLHRGAESFSAIIGV